MQAKRKTVELAWLLLGVGVEGRTLSDMKAHHHAATLSFDGCEWIGIPSLFA